MSKDYKPGTVAYRCRLCGCLDKSLHTPDIFTTIMEARGYFKTRSFGGWPVPETSLHNCANGDIGVADLAGGVADSDMTEASKEKG